MATFGDIERALADLYAYRWAIAAVAVVVLAAAVFAGWRLGWHRFIADHRRAFIIGGTPAAIVGLFLLWSLASPLFTNVTVEEEFPFAANAVVPAGMTMADVEMVMAGMAMTDDAPMDESRPAASSVTAGALLAAGDDVVAMPMQDAMAMAAPGVEAEAAMQAATAQMAEQMGQVRPVTAGAFRDADAFHRGSGQAFIYAAPGGGHLLRLEDLDVTNGPALHVMLSPHPDPTRGDEVRRPGYADLGRLKGNRGNQNYVIPVDVDISRIQSVVIYCKPFSVVFSVATLEG